MGGRGPRGGRGRNSPGGWASGRSRGSSDGRAGDRGTPSVRPSDRGILQSAFAKRLDGGLKQIGWRPVVVVEQERGRAFGPGDTRRLIEPHYWAMLQAVPGRPTLMATADASVSVLEESVARFVWWASEWKPFWRSPALLLSGLARVEDGEDEVHRTVAGFLGDELTRLVPDLRHLVVECPGAATAEECGQNLADRAVEALTAALSDAGWGSRRAAR